MPDKVGRRGNSAVSCSRGVARRAWLEPGVLCKTEEEGMALLRKRIATGGLVLLSGLGLSACATTSYVDEQIATVNQRVSALESRLQQVEGVAQEANSTAQAAAGAAQTANQRLDQLTSRVDGLEQQMVQKRPRN
jgi:outer membrane murein-binding lipoprotein Lpp